MTTTTFLPQSRICSRNARSVSVNGRSADVTNSTRSARGTYSAVICSCSRITALVPGVSTMLMSSIAHRRDLRGRRRDPLLHPPLAGERVDERALAGVELADDDEQEQLVELFDGALERRHVVVAGAEADQAGAQFVEDAPLFAHHFLLSWIENAL